MDPPHDIAELVHRLVDEYRVRCLWFLRPDHYPRTREDMLCVLGYIERYGDREAFRQGRHTETMALTPFQRAVCRLLAENRKAGGESYVAGGASLNQLTAGTRISRDIDLFHDTEQALELRPSGGARRVSALRPGRPAPGGAASPGTSSA